MFLFTAMLEGMGRLAFFATKLLLLQSRFLLRRDAVEAK
jgi:hypothetical protein